MSKKISRKSIDDLKTEYLNKVRDLDIKSRYFDQEQLNLYEIHLQLVLQDKSLKQLFVQFYLNNDDETLKQIKEKISTMPIDKDLLIKFVNFIISQIHENKKPYPFQIIELKTEEQRNITNKILTEEQRNITNKILTEDDIEKLKVFNLLIIEFKNQKK
jgi:hypothetical protein